MTKVGAGFTLIEIMAVILILGILSTIVTVNILDRVEWAKVQTTKIKMRALEGSLEMFRMDQQLYPTTSQGLAALVDRPVELDDSRYYPESGYGREREALEDGWQRPFGYQSPPVRAPRGYDLWSLGRDGRDGGSGLDADLANWEGAS